MGLVEFDCLCLFFVFGWFFGCVVCLFDLGVVWYCYVLFILDLLDYYSCGLFGLGLVWLMGGDVLGLGGMVLCFGFGILGGFLGDFGLCLWMCCLLCGLGLVVWGFGVLGLS